jgi:hypothetical protein
MEARSALIESSWNAPRSNGERRTVIPCSEALRKDFWGDGTADPFLREAQRAGFLLDVGRDTGDEAPSVQHPSQRSSIPDRPATETPALDRLMAMRAEMKAAGDKRSDIDLDLVIFAKHPELYHAYRMQNTRTVTRSGGDE